MEVKTFMELELRIENLVYVASSFIILIIKGNTKQNSFFLFLSSP
jgi:hypothetical protein